MERDITGLPILPRQEAAELVRRIEEGIAADVKKVRKKIPHWDDDVERVVVGPPSPLFPSGKLPDDWYAPLIASEPQKDNS